MRILVACEESQAVTIELRKLGHEAYSCDIMECSGGHAEWHYQQDVFEVIPLGWDMMIAFPPCTHLAVSGARWFPEKIADGRQQDGIDFFMALANAPIDRIAIENPVGIMSSKFRKPDQIIQPYFFGDQSRKTTCLWLKGLNPLTHKQEDYVVPELYVCKNGKTFSKDYMVALKADENRGKLRSKTYPGIARAMATQWTIT